MSLTSGASISLAQDETGTEPSLCDAFVDDELIELLGARYDAEPGFDGCTWNLAVPFYLNAYWQTGDLEGSKQFWDPGEDVTVGGRPAWLALDQGTILIELDGGVVVLNVALTTEEPEDSRATIMQLGETLVSRAASLGGPAAAEPIDEGSAEDVASSHADPELEALFPTSVGGQELEITSMPPDDISGAEGAEEIEAALAAQGRSLADVTAGSAFAPDFSSYIFAIRVKGGDAIALLEPLAAQQAELMDAEMSTSEVAGKPVTVLAGASGTQYVYANGEVLWLVFATEPALSEIMAALP
jgi:hypothetical protein